MLLAGAAEALPLEYPGGGDGGDAHAVADEEDDVLGVALRGGSPGRRRRLQARRRRGVPELAVCGGGRRGGEYSPAEGVSGGLRRRKERW